MQFARIPSSFFIPVSGATLVASKHPFRVIAFALVGGALACDKDPSSPDREFSLSCPTEVLSVNAPISLTFSRPVSASSVTGANIVVTDARGVEIPGGVSRGAGAANTISFTSSAPLPFDTLIRVRVQNLLAEDSNAPIDVTICELRTELPPIRELFWDQLPSAGGNDLLGVWLVEPDFSYVISRIGTVFRWQGGPDFVAFPPPPYLSAGLDVSFVSRNRGFATFEDFRSRRGVVVETVDGGATFDTLAFAPLQSLNRTYFRPIPSAAMPFGVVAGGQTFNPAFFMKYRPETGTFTTQAISTAGGVNDVDFFGTDTTFGAASTLGIRLGTRDVLGTVFQTTDGGATWTEITGDSVRASTRVLSYRGVAVRGTGQTREIYVAGGSGFFARFRTTNGGASYTRTLLLQGVVANPDSTNPNALVFTDVQFAPDNGNIGWVIGAQQVGLVGGVPRYQGLIFQTRDGGQTWTRQGVRNAPAFGAEFPRLNRISVLSSTAVWLVGDGGAVLAYRPTDTQ